MDAGKIKFVDDDGSVEILEPPMTSRVHKESFETKVQEPQQETIEEESSSEEEVSIKSSSGEERPLTAKEQDVNEPIETLVKEPLVEQIIEDAVEQHVKGLEKMESVLSSSVEDLKSSVEEHKTDEVKDEIDKEALSLVANAVNDILSEERVPISPKGCCILQ